MPVSKDPKKHSEAVQRWRKRNKGYNKEYKRRTYPRVRESSNAHRRWRYATYSEVRKRTLEESRQFRRERWEESVVSFGDCCQLCKRKYYYVLYEVHHVDPVSRKMRGSSAVIGRHWGELDKCALLCLHCHRLVTFRRVSVQWQKREGLGWMAAEQNRVDEHDFTGQARYNRQHKRKRWAAAVVRAGGCCQCCDEIKDHILYDFHHVDPKQKTLQSKDAVQRQAWLELDKCALLCAHCHRLIEFGVIIAHFEKRDGLGWTVASKRYKFPPRSEDDPLHIKNRVLKRQRPGPLSPSH